MSPAQTANSRRYAGSTIRPIQLSLWQRATSLSDPSFAYQLRNCAASP